MDYFVLEAAVESNQENAAFYLLLNFPCFDKMPYAHATRLGSLAAENGNKSLVLKFWDGNGEMLQKCACAAARKGHIELAFQLKKLCHDWDFSNPLHFHTTCTASVKCMQKCFKSAAPAVYDMHDIIRGAIQNGAMDVLDWALSFDRGYPIPQFRRLDLSSERLIGNAGVLKDLDEKYPGYIDFSYLATAVCANLPTVQVLAWFQGAGYSFTEKNMDMLITASSCGLVNFALPNKDHLLRSRERFSCIRFLHEQLGLRWSERIAYDSLIWANLDEFKWILGHSQNEEGVTSQDIRRCHQGHIDPVYIYSKARTTADLKSMEFLFSLGKLNSYSFVEILMLENNIEVLELYDKVCPEEVASLKGSDVVNHLACALRHLEREWRDTLFELPSKKTRMRYYRLIKVIKWLLDKGALLTGKDIQFFRDVKNTYFNFELDTIVFNYVDKLTQNQTEKRE